ncbi:hypothetical protein HDK90DRAFT_515698 [Phyllosticta capitalensis]|uniref:Uncharacterized protein n=1 Tax=Phyllosticta capitalensis TaxID=121624 RepID=A0ABR1Y8I6_9PEZI
MTAMHSPWQVSQLPREVQNRSTALNLKRFTKLEVLTLTPNLLSDTAFDFGSSCYADGGLVQRVLNRLPQSLKRLCIVPCCDAVEPALDLACIFQINGDLDAFVPNSESEQILFLAIPRLHLRQRRGVTRVVQILCKDAGYIEEDFGKLPVHGDSASTIRSKCTRLMSRYITIIQEKRESIAYP